MEIAFGHTRAALLESGSADLALRNHQIAPHMGPAKLASENGLTNLPVTLNRSENFGLYSTCQGFTSKGFRAVCTGINPS